MRVVIKTGLAALFICASTPAFSEKIQSLRVGNWKGGVYTSNKTGKFIHCSAGASYKSGVVLAFGVTASMQWWMQMLNPQWSLNPGSSYPVKFWVDKGRAYNAKAVAVTKQAVRIKLPPDDALFYRFRRGNMLKISAAQNVFPFRLTTTSKLLSRLLNCATRYRKMNVASTSSDSSNPFAGSGNAASSNPFESGSSNSSGGTGTDVASANPAAKPQGGGQPTGEERAEATARLATLLAIAGVKDFKLIPAAEAKGSFKRHDSVWKAQGMLGSLRIVSPEEGIEPNAVKSSVIGSDAKACKGRFASGAMPTREGDSSDALHLFTACEGAERNWTAYYALFTRPAGGHYLMMVVGPMTNADTVKRTGTSMREVALSGVGN